MLRLTKLIKLITLFLLISLTCCTGMTRIEFCSGDAETWPDYQTQYCTGD